MTRAAPAAAISEEELQAIVGLAQRRGRIPGRTALRLVAEIQRLHLELLSTVLMGLQLSRELKRITDRMRIAVGPPGAPKLADFDS